MSDQNQTPRSAPSSVLPRLRAVHDGVESHAPKGQVDGVRADVEPPETRRGTDTSILAARDLKLFRRVGACLAVLLTTSALTAVSPLASATTPSVNVAAKASVTAAPLIKSVEQSAGVPLYGQVKHVSKPTTRRVKIQRLYKSKWRTVKTVVPKSDRSFVASVKAPFKIKKYEYRSALYSSSKSTAKLLDTDRFGLTVTRKIPRAVDSSCAVTNQTFNVSHRGYVLQEGVGLVGWRVYSNLRLYDLCDHGGIYGTVGIYKDNIVAKNGKYTFGPQYFARSTDNSYTATGLKTEFYASTGGWDLYYVYVNGDNIGMSRSTYFSYTTIGSALYFNGVGSSQKWDTCTRSINRWVC